MFLIMLARIYLGFFKTSGWSQDSKLIKVDPSSSFITLLFINISLGLTRLFISIGSILKCMIQVLSSIYWTTLSPTLFGNGGPRLYTYRKLATVWLKKTFSCLIIIPYSIPELLFSGIFPLNTFPEWVGLFKVSTFTQFLDSVVASLNYLYFTYKYFFTSVFD